MITTEFAYRGSLARARWTAWVVSPILFAVVELPDTHPENKHAGWFTVDITVFGGLGRGSHDHH